MSAEEATQKKQVDWSSSFIRTRTEMTVTTVILLAVTHLDMSLTKIPGFGIELTHSAPRAGILAFLVVFFLYFTAAFVVKFLTEYGDVNLPSEVLLGLNAGFDSRVQQLVSFKSGPFSEEVERQAEILTRALAEYKETTWGRVEELAAIADLKVSGKRLQPDPFFMDAPPIGTVVDEAERDRIIKLYYDYLEGEKRGNAGLYKQTVARFEADATKHLQTVGKTLDEFQTMLSANVAQYQTEVSEQAEQVKNELSRTRDEINRIRKQIRNLATAITWDKLWFGFRLPLAFALISFAYTLPQAIADMAPLRASVKKCLPPTAECFYRDPPTLIDNLTKLIKVPLG